MKLFSRTIFLLVLGLATACEAQPTKSTPPAKAPAAAPAARRAAAPAAPKTPAYEVHGVLDPGLNNMVAFAFKAPWAWKIQQSFTRLWNGSAPVNQVYFRLTSPDGREMFESLPSSIYHFNDGPTSRSLRQTSLSMGLQQPSNPGEAAPVPPLAYIKQALLPQLAQRGLQFRPTGEHAEPPKATGPGKSTAGAYVDGVLPSGQKARVACGISYSTTNMNGETYTTWEVSPTVTLSARDLAACYAYTKLALNSIVLNPAWLQQTAQLARNGYRANDEITRRTAEQNRDYRENQRRVNDEVTRDRNRSTDQRNEAFRDALGNEGKFDDPTTGQRTQTTDQYAHVYKDRQGNVYGSHTPLDAGRLDWQELQRVETRNY
ncbi:hypothetical protein [Hymenobacter ruricola]|uniref:Lipoprotein n=1 Tax=Hymenobacter ruricola TaxID=2791023 RepID=A0ABS0I5M9_9BACT|nr:hypothetical protein [Hymenobacter ruricola]MBF9222281.1 hypothetical protein [Hymenobacter ruricola]